MPKKSRHIKVDIVVGINSSSVDQMCSSYEIEEHRGPCRCKCLTKTCHYNKDFDRDNCQCRCKPEFAALKRECATTGNSQKLIDFHLIEYIIFYLLITCLTASFILKKVKEKQTLIDSKTTLDCKQCHRKYL